MHIGTCIHTCVRFIKTQIHIEERGIERYELWHFYLHMTYQMLETISNIFLEENIISKKNNNENKIKVKK